MAPLAALFHIAQDANGPKIPGGVSSVLRDFLRKCFHKQPEFRKGADELLDHPWLRVKRENVAVEATLRRHGINNSDESSVLQMQELKQSIQATLRRNVTFTRRRKVGVGSNKTVEDEKNAQSVDDSLNSNRHQYQESETTVDLSAFDIDDSTSRDSDGDSSSDWDQDISLTQKNNVSQSSALVGKSKSLVHIVKEDEISNDFWDDDDTMEKIREMKESLKTTETNSLKNTRNILFNDKEENVQLHKNIGKPSNVNGSQQHNNADATDASNLENKLEMFKENESDLSMSEMSEFSNINNVSKRKRLQTLNSTDLASIDFGNDVHETVDEVRVDKLLMFQDSDSSDAFDGIEDDFASELKRNPNKSEDVNFDDFSDKDNDSENEVDDGTSNAANFGNGKISEPTKGRPAVSKLDKVTHNVEPKAADKQISAVDYEKPEDDLDDLEFDDVQDFHSRLALVQNNRSKKTMKMNSVQKMPLKMKSCSLTKMITSEMKNATKWRNGWKKLGS